MEQPLLEPPQPSVGRRRVAWPVAMWPAADQAAWLAARQSESLISDVGAADEWRRASIKSAIGAYGRWLAWLASRGELDMASEPADRFTPALIRTYVEYLGTHCSSVTVASYIAVLSMMIQAMVPDRDWDWLRAIHTNLQRKARPSRDKRSRIVHIQDLLKLGLDLMVAAEAGTPSNPRAAAAAARNFRDGLIIAILSMRPLRQKNLLEIEIGRHLAANPNGHTLQFANGEMKGGRPFQVTFPRVLEGVLARYISNYRPVLTEARSPRDPRYPGAPAGQRLWVAQGGTLLTAGALDKALARHTRPRFGDVVSSHLFRASVATTIAYDDPEHVRICAHILGHSRFSTTEGYYIVAQSVAAGDYLHELIETIRSDGKKSNRPASLAN